MIWPEKPTCHDDSDQAQRFPDHLVWRRTLDMEHLQKRYPGLDTRMCGYCGSMHPEDLIRALDAGAQLGGSDWKYGWPHKFYLHAIPWDGMERQAEIGGLYAGGTFTPHYGPAGAYTGKWYNTHLNDAGFDDEALALLLARLSAASEIEWFKDATGIGYRAPHAGYQR